MNEQILSKLYQWYVDYVNIFNSDAPKYRINICMKDQHTRRVCKNIIDIGKSINLDKNNLQLAEVVALLHDVGRFSQYDRYRTFSDAKSEDHAQLGVKVIQQYDVLTDVGLEVKNLILKTIGYHNKRELPASETNECLLFTKLLRDVDKLDILKVVTDHYLSKNETKNDALELGLPDIPEISDKVILDIKKGKTVNYDNVKTLNDFKILQMSWLYDINYSRTYKLIRRRNYMGIIYKFLPNTGVVNDIYNKFTRDLNEMC